MGYKYLKKDHGKMCRFCLLMHLNIKNTWQKCDFGGGDQIVISFSLVSTEIVEPMTVFITNDVLKPLIFMD